MIINGRLMFHSETGTEGGWYCVQDNAWSHGREVETCPWGALSDCPAFLDHWPKGWTPQHSSYEGLITLKNGDQLIISNDIGEVLWSGVVQLRSVNSYGPDGGTGGWRVHQKPENVDDAQWLGWFAKEHPVVLERAEP